MKLSSQKQDLLLFLLLLNSSSPTLIKFNIDDVLQIIFSDFNRDQNLLETSEEYKIFYGFEHNSDFTFEYNNFEYRILYQQDIDDLFEKSLQQNHKYELLNSGELSHILNVDYDEIEYLIRNNKTQTFHALCSIHIKKIAALMKKYYGYCFLYDLPSNEIEETLFYFKNNLYYLFKKEIK